MQPLFTKNALVTLVVILAVLFGLYYFFVLREREAPPPPAVQPAPLEEHAATSSIETIGTSVEGRAIEAYTFGNGETGVLFVGGIHGGYEWNSILLAYEYIDYLSENPEAIPKNLTVSIIPSANPDGLFEVIGVEGRFTLADVPEDEGPAGTGRFNANSVDLNRNFDCKWEQESMWRGNTVSAGTEPFSEPESQAIRDYVLKSNPAAVVFWHSQANAVYASECESGILPETITIMNTYADAAGYPAVDSFDAYPITGDAEGWLASVGIPSITVELKTHETVEWEKNLRGIDALLAYYASKDLAR